MLEDIEAKQSEIRLGFLEEAQENLNNAINQFDLMDI